MRIKRQKCIETGTVFYNIEDAKQFAQIKNSKNIYDCCCGLRKSSGGYHWEYVKET